MEFEDLVRGEGNLGKSGGKGGIWRKRNKSCRKFIISRFFSRQKRKSHFTSSSEKNYVQHNTILSSSPSFPFLVKKHTYEPRWSTLNLTHTQSRVFVVDILHCIWGCAVIDFVAVVVRELGFDRDFALELVVGGVF